MGVSAPSLHRESTDSLINPSVVVLQYLWGKDIHFKMTKSKNVYLQGS